jgi:dynein heavy chain
LDNVQSIAGPSAQSAAAGGSNSSNISTLITMYLNALPKPFDMFGIRSRITDWNPYIIVALQESERMNVLVAEIRRSLTELEMGLSGSLNVTDKMEELIRALSANKVYNSWEKLAFFSLKPLNAWMADLSSRASQLMEWTTSLKAPKSVWIAGLFNPMSYLTAVMQVTARMHSLPLDQMTLRCTFTNWRDPKAPDMNPPTNGVYIHGLFMEGASWEDGKGDEEGYICESKPKVLHPTMPVVNVIAVPNSEMDWANMYKCPVYVTSARGPTYIFTANVRMEPDDQDSKWILAGAALLLTDD